MVLSHRMELLGKQGANTESMWQSRGIKPWSQTAGSLSVVYNLFNKWNFNRILSIFQQWIMQTYCTSDILCKYKFLMPLSPSPFFSSQSKTLSVTNVDTANDVILMALQQLGINVSPWTSFNESFCSHFNNQIFSCTFPSFRIWTLIKSLIIAIQCCWNEAKVPS